MKKQNAFVFITARLKSSRLKKKIILPFGKKNILSYLIDSLKTVFDKNKIILITSKKKQDKPLIDLAKKNKINYFCGDAEDVLKRIYQAAKSFKAQNVISCTADNPLTDPKFAMKLYKFHIKNNYDMSSNDQLPIGTFCYCLKIKAVEKVLQIKKNKDTEIWGDYFRKLKIFKCGSYNKIPKKYSNLNIRLTVDYLQDYKFINTLYNLTRKSRLTLDDIVKILKKNKGLLKINKGIIQNKSKGIIIKKRFNDLLN